MIFLFFILKKHLNDIKKKKKHLNDNIISKCEEGGTPSNHFILTLRIHYTHYI